MALEVKGQSHISWRDISGEVWFSFQAGGIVCGPEPEVDAMEAHTVSGSGVCGLHQVPVARGGDPWLQRC